jgi:putative transposase
MADEAPLGAACDSAGMPNTYTQIYLHVVFAVAQRACVISSARKEELQKYITGIVTRQGQKLIAINCMPDHTHVLVGLKPNAAPSDLIGDIKTGSTNHINEQRWIGCRFSWQEGFGAFSVSHSHLGAVIDYIRNQETHHHRQSFQQEYVEFLERHDVPYDERYVFKSIE